MAWRPLQISLSASEHLPPLLISSSFTKNGYTINVTDLTHIWGESLDRAAIIRRGKDEGTSIDPSEGDQFQIFIEKIKIGLDGEEGSTLALTVNSDTARPSLTLHIFVALPGGLGPLAWQVQLAPLSQSKLTNQFIVPLIEAQYVHMQETASLVKALKDKDHVIQKLMDKLESQNLDCHDLFPQLGGRAGRKVDKKQAEERVKGLGRFDTATWKKGVGIKESRDTVHLIGQVFMDNEIEDVSADGSLREVAQDGWWDSIKGITVSLGSGKISTNGSTDKPKLTPRAAVVEQDTVEDDDDAFQVQATPAHLVKSVKDPVPKADESTDDEDDLDMPSQRSKIPDSYPADPPLLSPPKPKKKLGKIGGNKTVVRPKLPIHDDLSTEDEDEEEDQPAQKPIRTAIQKAKPVPEVDEQSTEDEAASPKISLKERTVSLTPEKQPAKPTRRLGKIGGKKEAPPPPEPDVKSGHEATPPPVKLTSPSEAPNPKRGNLGKIGGKKKIAAPELEQETVATRSSPGPEEGSLTKRRRLGAIGGHKTVTTEADLVVPVKPEEIQDRGRASTRPRKEKTPELRETSTERAHRRREELKKELEQKAKAPPKKKRKF